jgi:hypothetical protein
MRYYVYVHKKLTDGEIFYVGKGQDDRAWSIEGRTRQWIKIAAECGRGVEIVAWFDLEADALRLESMLILLHGAKLANVLRQGHPSRKGKGRKALGRPHAPEVMIDGEPAWTWKQQGSYKTWQTRTITFMMRNYGGSRQAWQDVVDRFTETGPKGWRLIVRRKQP